MILAQQLGGVEVAESLCNVAHWYIACVLDQEYNLKTDFVMKTDDDTFLRVDAVLSTIFESKQNSTHSLFLGNLEFAASPERDPSNKWFVNREVMELSFRGHFC